MRYQRMPHRVRAEELTAIWEWSTNRGERMVALPGDYRLCDAAGAQWSVSPEALSEGYRSVGAGRYESRGSVEARHIDTDGEPKVVVTREGLEEARPGDWVLRDSSGNEWVVDERWFREHYSVDP